MNKYKEHVESLNIDELFEEKTRVNNATLYDEQCERKYRSEFLLKLEIIRERIFELLHEKSLEERGKSL